MPSCHLRHVSSLLSQAAPSLRDREEHFNESDDLLRWTEADTRTFWGGRYLHIFAECHCYEAAVNHSGDHLYYMGLGGHKGSGMFSYPNYNGRFKSLDHPDIYQLGLLDEQAGMDYRVLVLQRNGLDILKSVDR